MTKPQEYYIAIGLFFEQWHRCKSICESFFKDAERSYQHMNLSDAQYYFQSMCRSIEDIEPTELQYIDQTSSTKSND